MGVRVGGLVVVSPELVQAARASRPVPAPPMSTLLKRLITIDGVVGV